MSKIEYKEIIVFHPGYYIKDIIEDMEMTQSEFAKRLNTTNKTLSKLLNGKTPLSGELAKSLSQMLGTSIDVWLNLQEKYDKELYEIQQRKTIDEEIKHLKDLNYKYFEKLNAVPACKNKNEQVIHLRKFLQVSSLDVLAKQDLLVACKTSIPNVELKHVINANAWIQTGINFAKKLKCNSFDRQKLTKYLPEIRQMTIQSPEDFYPRLKQIFNECGIAFIALPYLANSGINGAVKWVNADKALLLINDRNKHADIFWFALFHEIKHILQQKIKTVYLSYDKRNVKFELGSNNELNEQEADDFARNQLIPDNQYQEFVNNQSYTKNAILHFAKNIGIHPCIVLGRLQRDGHIGWNMYSDLRIQYKIV